MYKFSEQLRDEAINYFKENHNHLITHEIADEYLLSLAGLYRTFKKVAQKKIASAS